MENATSKAENLLTEIDKMYNQLQGMAFPEPNSERGKDYEGELIDALKETLSGLEGCIFYAYYLNKEVRIENGELI